jgi:hypothetical protein
MMPVPIAKLMDIYYRGSLTPMQTGMQLVQSACDYPPEQYAVLIPAEVLQAIRKFVESPPANLEETAVVHEIRSWVGPYDHEVEERKRRQQLFDGIWRWHRLFRTDVAEK